MKKLLFAATMLLSTELLQAQFKSIGGQFNISTSSEAVYGLNINAAYFINDKISIQTGFDL